MTVATLEKSTTDLLDGDKGRTVVAMATARAWKDVNYKQRLLDDPKAVLAAEGLELEADINVVVLEDTDKVKYVNLSRGEIGEREEVSLVMLIQNFLPIPEGHEVRFVQSTDKTRYLVLRQLPASIQPANLTEPELMNLTTWVGQTATVQTAEAVTTEVAVEETTTVTTAETTAEAAAEVVVVAAGAIVLT